MRAPKASDAPSSGPKASHALGDGLGRRCIESSLSGEVGPGVDGGINLPDGGSDAGHLMSISHDPEIVEGDVGDLKTEAQSRERVSYARWPGLFDLPVRRAMRSQQAVKRMEFVKEFVGAARCLDSQHLSSLFIPRGQSHV